MQLFFHAPSSKFSLPVKNTHGVRHRNSSRPVINTQTEEKLLGCSFLHAEQQCPHKETGGGQSKHVYDSRG